MKTTHRLLTAGLLLGFSLPAFAGSCPLHLKKIDAALAAGPSLSAAELERVRELRDNGERQHRSGDHAGSVASLREARELLGI